MKRKKINLAVCVIVWSLAIGVAYAKILLGNTVVLAASLGRSILALIILALLVLVGACLLTAMMMKH